QKTKHSKTKKLSSEPHNDTLVLCGSSTQAKRGSTLKNTDALRLSASRMDNYSQAKVTHTRTMK
ncbi:hypothetical protein P3546_23795, partial [Vibrio parahaemolyticus]|nr:hypothetical protein [Vibrio parahaemolyticus]